MSSIYVSMPSMNDNELIASLKNCIHQASKENTVNIGVAFSSLLDININFYIDEIDKLDNVKFQYFDINDSIGVGAARRNAYSFYNGEDYLLQIDAHSFFKKNWDKQLIENLNNANSIYGKSILTCYPPAYKYVDNLRVLNDGWSRITTEIDGGVLSDTRYYDNNKKYVWDFLPNWFSPSKKFFYDDYEEILKVSAGFLFGGKEFAEGYLDLIPYNYIFFEEEIIMSTELLYKGYNLIAPSHLPIAHLYSDDMDDYSFREGLNTSIVLDNELVIKNNFYDYCYNNVDKVNLLNKRLGIDIFEIIKKSESRMKNDSTR